MRIGRKKIYVYGDEFREILEGFRLEMVKTRDVKAQPMNLEAGELYDKHGRKVGEYEEIMVGAYVLKIDDEKLAREVKEYLKEIFYTWYSIRIM